MYRKQVRRRRAVLALLIVGSFLLLTLTYQGSRGLQSGVSAVFSPVQSVADRALKPARDLVDWFDKTFEARGENSRLREQLAGAREEAVAGQVALNENAQLRKLLGLDRKPALVYSSFEPLTARVIARSPTQWRSSITLDAGSGDGVRVDDPVVGDGALVGRIASAGPGSSQVMLLTDHASAVSAKVVPPGGQGVVKPEVGNPDDLILDFIDSTRGVHNGLAVVTAGWRAQTVASHFPAGIPIGEVTSSSVVEQEASQQVHVRPYADLPNLDFVQVLIGGGR